VLSNKLRMVVVNVASKSKSAFIKGEQIFNGILIANEWVDDDRRSKKNLLIFKVDFEKAYDLVDWRYLGNVMVKINFPPLWCKLILECVTTLTGLVLVNGSPTDVFILKRGFRQGDPLCDQWLYI